MNSEAYKMFSVENKVIVITGGAGFLGMQFAKALGLAGAQIVIWDNCDFSFLQSQAVLLRQKNIKCIAQDVDLTDMVVVNKMANSVIEKFDRIDVLINNAALNPAVDSAEAEQMFSPYEKYPVDLFKKEVEVDLVGTHLCIRAAAPQMMKQRSGVVVNIASEYANLGANNRIYGEGQFKSIAYITAKSGVLGLTRGWASYLGEYGVRVNAFIPGGMPKPEVSEEFRRKYSSLNMLGRTANPGEYDGAILFLCSDASSFMTGNQLVMDGGKSAW